VSGLIRELRIRWKLFRRGHTLGRRHLVLLIVAVAAIWVGASLCHGLGSDAALHRQLGRLEVQSQAIERQVQAQREELSSAPSLAAQAEIARSQGLSEAGEQVYVLESPVEAAGPVAIQQATSEVGQTAQSVVQTLLGVP
jgi:cell division protein FtsB